jgi:FkbM family methyltransferase
MPLLNSKSPPPTNTGNYTWAFKFIDKPINNIVEVGSRDALDAIELSRYFSANVLAFEPDPESILICKKNLKLNNKVPVQLFTQVLSNINGFIGFNIYSSGNSSIYKHKTENITKAIKLKTSRFDSLNLVTPDLLVIDAQSSEFEILEGFGQSLTKTKYIIFETGFHSIYDSKKNFDFCNRYLKNLGFTFLATNVSGRGILRFYLMRLRGVFYYFRKYGFRGLQEYSGFFDVLYVNNLVTITLTTF